MSDIIRQLFEDSPENPRERLEKLTQAMMGLPETYEPALSHYRADGLYGRRIYVPAGMCVATRVHKQEHFTIALKGQCLVVDENGNKGEVNAPAVFVTKPGTQRACLAITDVEWLTVHAADIDDPSRATDLLTCRTFAEFERHQSDRDDYQKVLDEHGITEAQAMAISERKEADEFLPVDGVVVVGSGAKGKAVFATRNFGIGVTLGHARKGHIRSVIGRYSNHSTEPNLDIWLDEEAGDIYVKAASDIHYGDELTVDYRRAFEAARMADDFLEN